jgi:elongation factor 4
MLLRTGLLARRGHLHATLGGRGRHFDIARAFASTRVRLPAEVDDETFLSIPQDRVRNFSIVAHVDHGKSTLADRLMELTGAIKTDGGNKQVLDSLKVEQERGITVKSQTASLVFVDPVSDAPYLLNLIDTPGHVDFAYEVSRSLAACQGALLLVDSTQGVQAQTLANYRIAQEANLTVIPVLTKLDLPHSDPAKALDQIERAFGFSEDQVIWTSAKSGEGVDEILPELIKRVPAPKGSIEEPLRGLIVDSWHNSYRGVTCLVSVVDGSICKGARISMASTKKKFDVQEVGILTPHAMPTTHLRSGQVGYVIAGVKDTADARVGDTMVMTDCVNESEALPGFQPVKPMLFSSVYPVEASHFDNLRQALDRLMLNDSSVKVVPESSTALGQGFRVGFLGKLHMEVFHQRLKDEHGMNIIATAPMVPFEAKLKDGSTVPVEKPSEMNPLLPVVETFYESIASVEIVTPPEYIGSLMQVLQDRRATQEDIVHLDADQVVLKYTIPWQEVVTDLYDEIKSVSSGFASFDYNEAGTAPANIVCVDMLLNGEAVDALSFVCHRKDADVKGRAVAKRLKTVIARQQYEINIQAAIGAKILAKQRIPPYRKDVLMKSGKAVGGGDSSRKKKLLEKQKKGKKRMKMVGSVELNQKAFMAVLHKE